MGVRIPFFGFFKGKPKGQHAKTTIHHSFWGGSESQENTDMVCFLVGVGTLVWARFVRDTKKGKHVFRGSES